MFDLFRSRQKTMKYLLTGLLSLVAISMVVTLIPGFGSQTGSGPDQVIAEIGKDSITMRDVQMVINDTIKGRQIPNELISVYVPQILNQVVVERALAYYATSELGYKVTDEDVADVIRRQVPSLFEGGKFVGKEAYQNFLSMNNTSIAEFERRARLMAAMRRIQGMALEGMVVTPAEVEREYRSRNDKITLDYVKIDPAKLTAEVKITQDEINAHWTVAKANYKIPERRAFRMLIADEAKIGESLKLADDELLQYYNANKEQFRSAERVKVRHILIKTMDKPKDQEAALKKKAEDLLKQVRAGGDFAEIAKKNSEDASNAQKGGDLDWVQKGQMVKAFEDTAFALKTNQISDVVKTEFGFHIVQTTAREDARLKPFEEVKETLQKDRVKQQVYDRMTAAAEQSRAALAKDPAAAEQIAQKYSLHFAKVDRAGRGDPIPQIGASVEFDDALFDLKKSGEVTPVVQTQGNKLVIAVLDGIQPPRQAELSEKESEVRTVLQNERVQRLLAERANALMDKLKTNGGDLKAAAAALKLEVKTAPEFTRDGQAEGIGPAAYLEEGFKRETGAVFGPIDASGAKVVCKVSGRTAADLSKLELQRYDILIRLKQRKAQERRDLFEDGILQHLKAKKVVKIHEDTVKRLTESFKTS